MNYINKKDINKYLLAKMPLKWWQKLYLRMLDLLDVIIKKIIGVGIYELFWYRK